MENLSEKSMKDLKFYGWALTQDRLHLGDIIDRSKDQNHIEMVRNHIAEIDAELEKVRAEIKRRKN